MKLNSVTVRTYYAEIYFGTKEGYEGDVASERFVYSLLQDYVDKVGLGLFVQKGEFLYTKGNEPGYKVTIINYPRFPSTSEEIHKHAEAIVEILLRELKQYRITVCYPQVSMMYELEESNE
jgi:hypothetical protein